MSKKCKFMDMMLYKVKYVNIDLSQRREASFDAALAAELDGVSAHDEVLATAKSLPEVCFARIPFSKCWETLVKFSVSCDTLRGGMHI